MVKYNIRKADINDLEQITKLESLCFPESEAATRESFKRRLTVYPDYFFVLTISDNIVAMVNGMVTDNQDLIDEMYDDEEYHNVNGDWQMIFGVDTHHD